MFKSPLWSLRGFLSIVFWYLPRVKISKYGQIKERVYVEAFLWQPHLPLAASRGFLIFSPRYIIKCNVFDVLIIFSGVFLSKDGRWTMTIVMKITIFMITFMMVLGLTNFERAGNSAGMRARTSRYQTGWYERTVCGIQKTSPCARAWLAMTGEISHGFFLSFFFN